MPLGSKQDQYFLKIIFFILLRCWQQLLSTSCTVPQWKRRCLPSINTIFYCTILGNNKKDINITTPAGIINFKSEGKRKPVWVVFLCCLFHSSEKKMSWKQHFPTWCKCRFLQQSWLGNNRSFFRWGFLENRY